MDTETKQQASATAFTFGDPEAVLENHLTDYTGVYYDEYAEYYRPPVEKFGLARLLRANSYHGSIVNARRNMVVRDYKGSLALSRRDMEKVATDLITFGEAYLQLHSNHFDVPTRLSHQPALYMRARKDGRFVRLGNNHFYATKQTKFKRGEIIQLKMYDVQQEIYGIPDYLTGLHSSLLSEEATLFRRRYYKNGAHMGFILYTTDPNLDPEIEKQLQEKISQSKGVGNFNSLFINIPKGDPDGIKLIPVGDIATKDEFERIKNISSQDIMVAHRFPPGLSGVMPSNVGGFGDVEKTQKVYYLNETKPLQDSIKTVNQFLPQKLQIIFETPGFMTDIAK